MFNNQGQHRRKQNLRKMDMEVKTVRGPQGPQEHRCTELEASEARVRGHGLPWPSPHTSGPGAISITQATRSTLPGRKHGWE